jgi:hypothetical protein
MKISQFGSYDIPQAKAEWDFPLGSLAGGQELLAAAGVWDDLGDLVVLRPGLVGATFKIHGDSWDDVDDELDDCRAALLGERALLKATVGDDASASRQAMARCVSLDVPYSFDAPRQVICKAQFELLQPHWDSILSDDESIHAATSGTSFTLSNNSTCQVQRTLTIRIYELSVVLTLTNTTNGMSFTYDGASSPIPGAYAVKVDCGALTVTYAVGSADRWEYFSIGDDQIGFMALEPGNNAFTVSTASYTTLYFLWKNAYL